MKNSNHLNCSRFFHRYRAPLLVGLLIWIGIAGTLVSLLGHHEPSPSFFPSVKPVAQNSEADVNQTRLIDVVAIRTESAPALPVLPDLSSALNKTFTIDGWILATSLPQRGSEWCFVSHGSWEESFKLSLPDDTHIRFTIRLADERVIDLTSSVIIQPNQWYHVVASYDVAGVALLFINGVTESAFTDLPPGPLHATKHDLTVGRCTRQDGNPFRGYVANLRVWNRVFQSQDFQLMLGPTFSTPPGSSPVFDTQHHLGHMAHGGGDITRLTIRLERQFRWLSASGPSLLYFNVTQNGPMRIPLSWINSPPVDEGREMSVAAWVRLAAYPVKGTERCVVSHGSWTGRFKFSITDHGRLELTLRLADGRVVDLYGRRSLQLHQWYHVAFTYRADGEVYVFVNGLADLYPGLAQFPRDAGRLHLCKALITVGQCLSTDANVLDGEIGNVAVWDHALSVHEIRTLLYGPFQASTSGSPPVFDSRLFGIHNPLILWSPPRLSYGAVVRRQDPGLDATRAQVSQAFQSLSQSHIGVSVVIVVEQKWFHADRLLQSLRASASKRFMLEVILVERSAHLVPENMSLVSGGSTDASGSSITYRVLRAMSHERSWSQAMQMAVKVASFSWLHILHDHSIVTEGWLEALWPYTSDARTAAISSKILYPNGLVRHAGYAFYVTPVMDEELVLPFARYRGYSSLYLPASQTAMVPAVSTHSVLIRRELLSQVSSFDDRFEPVLHDVDLMLTLRSQGYRCVLVHDSIVFNTAPELPDSDTMFSMWDVHESAVAQFSKKWDAELRPEVTGQYEVNAVTRWVMHCGGSQGLETARILQGLENRLPIRTQNRRAATCEHSNTINHALMPAEFRERVERTRELRFPEPDSIVVYHRDYRELGQWLRGADSPKYVIGRYMFETNGLHYQWVDNCNEIDEIWVPSQFHVDMFAANRVRRDKLFVIPEAIDPDLLDPEIIEPLYLPGRKKYMFLSVFKFEERKGWKELIAAYFQEFSAADDVTLCIHTYVYQGEGDLYDPRRLMKIVMEYAEEMKIVKPDLPHLMFTGRYLDPDEMLRLYRSTDAFVLPSHGEGWGLPYQEAMTLGKPTLGTAWSGMTEFMTPSNSFLIEIEGMMPSDVSDRWLGGFQYAQPSVSDLRRKMRFVFEHPQVAQAVGERARGWMREKYSHQAVGDVIMKRLKAIVASNRYPPRRIPRVDLFMMPIDPAVKAFFSVRAIVTAALVSRHVAHPRGSALSASSVMSGAPGGGKIRMAVISTYPPRFCGIATFSEFLIKAMLQYPVLGAVEVLPMVLDTFHNEHDSTLVRRVIRAENLIDYEAAAQYIEEQRFEVVLVQHEFGIFGGRAGSYILRLLDRLRIPVISTIHTLSDTLSDDERGVLLEVIRRSSRVVVMSELAVKHMDIYHGVERSLLTVIPHGAPETTQVPVERAKQVFNWQERRVILSNGLISPGKGMEYMVAALPEIVRHFPDVLYVIVGRPFPACGQVCIKYLESLKRSVRQLNMTQNVLFVTEFVPLPELVRYLQAADIFVTCYPDPTVSNSGTVSMAMAVGRVVVATPFTFAKIALRQNRGVLVPFKNSLALAKAIVGLLNDPIRMREIGERAYQYMAAIQWHKVAKSYLELASDVVMESSVHTTNSTQVIR
eukprot:TRINITY_DN4488_c0_g4_i3.p1 TRINITY_DN4488_c0_g4~~TRINITY_DN4488_c0_g4_i3.p1  ORF type:complete len:1638 (+),score=410.79 TRINITY_DN4488_c0_g4_i3:94-5007(+)